MESAKNIHLNVNRIAAELGLKGAEIARKSTRYGGISQKTVSNIMRKPFEPGNCNIGVDKLDVIAATLKTSPQALIMPENSRMLSEEEFDMSLKEALKLMAETEVINEETFNLLMDLSQIIAVTQHSVLFNKEESPKMGLLKHLLSKLPLGK